MFIYCLLDYVGIAEQHLLMRGLSRFKHMMHPQKVTVDMTENLFSLFELPYVVTRCIGPPVNTL